MHVGMNVIVTDPVNGRVYHGLVTEFDTIKNEWVIETDDSHKVTIPFYALDKWKPKRND